MRIAVGIAIWAVVSRDAFSQAPNGDADVALAHSPPAQVYNECKTCHGNVEGAAVWQRATTMWFDHDPHSQAYSKLLNAQSQRIVHRLVGKNLAADSEEYRSVLRDQCVSCHANEHAPDDQIRLGIDCQVCHGPASAWGEAHYAGPTLALGPKRFENTARVNLESIRVRAEVCTSCHIGELDRGSGLRDREVDHRLMAAGHPGMYFDFENYLERYPKHWDVQAEEKRLGEFPAYTRWSTGKWVAARVRLELLRDRAERRVGTTARDSARRYDWPEFTESSCTSCHHKLLPESWREAAPALARAGWDDWYTPSIERMLRDTSDADERERWEQALAKLRSNLESRQPAPAEVAEPTAVLIDLCRRRLESDSPADAVGLRNQLRGWLEDESMTRSWERGAQWATTVRMFCDSLGLERGNAAIAGSPEGGFFGPPRLWNPLPDSPGYQSSDWFRPESLVKTRETLLNRLGPRP
ncbi:MAG: multiheme c-type cytochrome [Pirellula sp.]